MIGKSSGRTPAQFTRATFLKIFFSLFAVAIASKALTLQLMDDPRLDRLSQRQFRSKLTVMPRRGLILDRNGEGLAISNKVHSLFFRPALAKKEIPKKAQSRLIANLAQILQMPQSHLQKNFNSNKGFVWVKRQLSENEEQLIRDRGMLEYGDGIGLAEETRRFYPNRELSSHILGSVNVDGLGTEGLELYYDSILNGTSAKVSSTKDAMGRRIFDDGEGLAAVKDGMSLILTIDKAIQYETEKALKKSIEEFDAKAGVAIVADVESGEILAMTNYPTFNPNQPKNYSADQKRNRAITDAYEPGSTFKPLLVAMAIDKGKNHKAKINCEGGSFVVGGRRISEAETHEKFEWLSLGEILKYSSNVGAAKLSLLLGSNTVAQLFDRLKLGSKMGIDLPGEASGLAKKNELKSIVRLANVGFGHGIAVTPIQMLSYYMALANEGVWMQPKLVKAIIQEDPEALEKGSLRWKIGEQKTKPVTRQLFSAQTARWVNEMLETVPQEKGTATKAQLEEWPVAGKTGTAQKIDPETRRYSNHRYLASFVGFAPAKKPKLVTFVMLDEPKKKYYASETAAPAFAEIMRTALMREGIAPANAAMKTLQLSNRSKIENLPKDDEPLPEAMTARMPAAEQPALLPEDDNRIRFPNLRGYTVREALKVLSNEPLQVEIIGSGILKEQSPAPEQWVSAGTRVRLVFDSKSIH